MTTTKLITIFDRKIGNVSYFEKLFHEQLYNKIITNSEFTIKIKKLLGWS